MRFKIEPISSHHCIWIRFSISYWESAKWATKSQLHSWTKFWQIQQLIWSVSTCMATKFQGLLRVWSLNSFSKAKNSNLLDCPKTNSILVSFSKLYSTPSEKFPYLKNNSNNTKRKRRNGTKLRRGTRRERKALLKSLFLFCFK